MPYASLLKYLHLCFSGLGEVFVVGVCLLTLVRVPTVMSAPSTRYVHSHKGGHKAPEDSPSYMYPCGKSHEEEMKYSSTSRESDSEILKHIIISTKSALSYAESFRDRYVSVHLIFCFVVFSLFVLTCASSRRRRKKF